MVVVMATLRKDWDGLMLSVSDWYQEDITWPGGKPGGTGDHQGGFLPPTWAFTDLVLHAEHTSPTSELKSHPASKRPFTLHYLHSLPWTSQLETTSPYTELMHTS